MMLLPDVSWAGRHRETHRTHAGDILMHILFCTSDPCNSECEYLFSIQYLCNSKELTSTAIELCDSFNTTATVALCCYQFHFHFWWDVIIVKLVERLGNTVYLGRPVNVGGQTHFSLNNNMQLQRLSFGLFHHIFWFKTWPKYISTSLKMYL